MASGSNTDEESTGRYPALSYRNRSAYGNSTSAPTTPMASTERYIAALLGNAVNSSETSTVRNQ